MCSFAPLLHELLRYLLHRLIRCCTGLDSVDALQLVVALDKRYGIKISDAAVARKVMHTITSIATAIEAHQAGINV